MLGYARQNTPDFPPDALVLILLIQLQGSNQTLLLKSPGHFPVCWICSGLSKGLGFELLSNVPGTIGDLLLYRLEVRDIQDRSFALSGGFENCLDPVADLDLIQSNLG